MTGRRTDGAKESLSLSAIHGPRTGRDAYFETDLPPALDSVRIVEEAERKHFVSRDVISLAINAYPKASFRPVVSLARDAALRTPSKIDDLTWSDFDWEPNQFKIIVHKTEHLDGHEP